MGMEATLWNCKWLYDAKRTHKYTRIFLTSPVFLFCFHCIHSEDITWYGTGSQSRLCCLIPSTPYRYSQFHCYIWKQTLAEVTFWKPDAKRFCSWATIALSNKCCHFHVSNVRGFSSSFFFFEVPINHRMILNWFYVRSKERWIMKDVGFAHFHFPNHDFAKQINDRPTDRPTAQPTKPKNP